MMTPSTLLLLWGLVSAACAQSSELSGVYVNAKSPYHRIEFLADGKCIFGFGDPAGNYTREKDTVVCMREDEERFAFRLKDKVLVDEEGKEWVRREELAKVPWKDVRPVTMVVLDSETRAPITRFAYTYEMSTPTAKYDPLLVRPTEVQSDNGSFILMAPESCEIEMRVQGGNILGGFGAWKSHILTSDNRARKIEVLVRTGITVEGEVVDACTGKPIEGALASPIIFTPPGLSSDKRRAVKTDAAGKFMIPGVDPWLGIKVWHSQYLESGCGGFEGLGAKASRKLYSAKIGLESGERLFGVVKDPAGQPLAGVKVSDGAGKAVKTGVDGSFVLAGPTKWGRNPTYNLSFKKDGYLDAELLPKSADPKGFAVVLQPVPVLTGAVLDPNGRPVETYTVAAGVGLEPRPWRCSTRQVHDHRGRFSLPVRTDYDYDNQRQVWVGVKAQGFALWETTVGVWKGANAVTARLTPGVAVRGSVTTPIGHAQQNRATLLPARVHQQDYTRETSQRQELGRMETCIEPSGGFRFEHVALGRYLLAIAGPTISPVSVGIAVSGSDLDAGTFSLQGRGSVAGVVYQPELICEGEKCRLDEKRRPWAFAAGHVSFCDASGRSNDQEFEHLKPIPFKADENGRFHVDGIPVGLVSLAIPYHVTADIIGAHTRNAMVLAGRTTEVRFFDTSGRWELACNFRIGDGSPAQFASGTGMGAKRKVANVTTRPPMLEVELQPIDDMPVSFCGSDWYDLDAPGEILLRDVHPGKYRAVVRDWQGSRGLHGDVCETSVEMRAGKTTCTILLSAGCVTGATQCSKQSRYLVHVIAVGKKTRTVRDAYADDNGNFCARYLPDDDYTLFAHGDDAGWCAMPEVTVRKNVGDVGSHKLVPGGTITGTVPPRLEEDFTAAVEAVDSHGIVIERLDRWEPIGKAFTIPGLWPGQWTVRLKEGNRSIAEKTVTLRGTATASCDFGGK